MRIKDLATRATKLLTGNAWFVVDNGTKVEKAAFSEVVKQGIEEYAGSTLAGSAQTVKSAIDALNGKMTSLSNDNRRMPKVIEYNNNASEPKTLNITLPQHAWSFMSILVLRPTAPVIISSHQNASAIYDINMKNIFTGELDSGVTYDGLVISIPTLGYETGYVFGAVSSISLT